MAQYKTPGVYVLEKDAFGSSIVANETAVPVFFGFTEKATQANGGALGHVEGSTAIHIPVLINSILEYTQSFGGPDITGTVEVKQGGTPDKPYYTSEIKKDAKPYTPGLLHPSVSNFFANGGGSCYIVSLGKYEDFNPAKSKPQFDDLVKAIQLAEQCTLLLPTDLIRFGPELYYTWANQLIDYCESSKKQFCVLDVIMDEESSTFAPKDIQTYREKVTSDSLKNAAAYYPYLKSLTPYAYDLNNVKFKDAQLLSYSANAYSYSGQLTPKDSHQIYLRANFIVQSDVIPKITLIEKEEPNSDENKIDINFAENSTNLTINITVGTSGTTTEKPKVCTASELSNKWNTITDKKGYELTFLRDFDGKKFVDSDTEVSFKEQNQWINEKGKDSKNQPIIASQPFLVIRNGGLPADKTSHKVSFIVSTDENGKLTGDNDSLSVTLPKGKENTGAALTWINDQIKESTDENVQAYTFTKNLDFAKEKITKDDSINLVKKIIPDNAKVEEIKAYLATNFINMPPSPFMAGIYSRMDNATGVWTPPANVAPNGVRGPLVPITHQQQENLNVDAVAGKSINAIRSFTGKGTLVWGARTNDGNSMDWRYVNVKRLFISMETDIRMALEAFVFKPNVHNTWVEVKTMIDSYLFGLFNQGAFAGTTPETSYQVLIGQGETMTDADILDGFMRATIMVAPVRPAEFIELTFTQMLSS